MSHSYVMTFDSEIEASRTFARDCPRGRMLLDQHLDVEKGRAAAQAAEELRPEGVKLAQRPHRLEVFAA